MSETKATEKLRKEQKASGYFVNGKCPKCGNEMKPSKAIVCRATGMADFADGEVVTMSPDPKQPVLVDCLKCVNCGWSVSHE